MAKNNIFRLQSVLNFKSGLVDNLEAEFAQLKTAHQLEVVVLQRLQRARNRETDSLRRQQGQGPLDCQAIQRHQQHLELLAAQLAQQAERVAKAKQRLETKRAELVKMMQDKKTLQKLQERHQANQDQTTRRKEASVIDDMVTSRYRRKR